MQELNFGDGIVTYTVNGKREVSFNPTDSNFVERLYLAFEDLDKKQEGYKTQIEKMGDKKLIFEFARERDKEMREIIDSVFGAHIADNLFGGMNVYALAEGVPVWCNFMLAVMTKSTIRSPVNRNSRIRGSKSTSTKCRSINRRAV